ncbi:MAG TPA: AAA family ATPase [Candidatus Magasanikbacteria bacterium]|nr:AAA family ATPase [Candidatus Magasanikbacteria bacterium]
MFLKSIEIQGFKSFAQKVHLDFIPPRDGKMSVTAIVGPNGSGKSNISDAIRWVMGEQSMKALRGKKSEDVIFAGSEAKGQLGMASVTLTLDNSDHRVDVEFDEIAITRRLYRSGDNEYVVNGQQIRLIDLQILLARAQFGQGSYSVVGQGMIDRLLLQTPEERKRFFDEAAGIKEFQIKRHQSILKMQHTEENLRQAEMLMNEVEPRLRALSRQVKKLEQRQDVENELRSLGEIYYTTLWQSNAKQLESLRGEMEIVHREYVELEKKLNIVQTELAKLAGAESRESLFAELQKKSQEVMARKNSLEKDRAIIVGKLQAEYSKVGKQNVGWLEGKITELKTKKEETVRSLTLAEEKYNHLNSDLLAIRSANEKLLLEKTETRNKILRLTQNFQQVKNDQSYWQLAGLKAVQAILEDRQRFNGVFGVVAQLGKVPEEYLLALDVAAGSNLSSIVTSDEHVAETAIQYLRTNELGVATFLPISKVKPRYASQDLEEMKKIPGVRGLALDLVDFDKKFSNIFSYIFGNTLVVENIEVARSIGIGRIRMVTLEGDVMEVSGSMRGGFRRGKRNGLSFALAEGGEWMRGVQDDERVLAEAQTRLERVEIESEKAATNLQKIISDIQMAEAEARIVREQKKSLDTEIATLNQELALCNMTPAEYGNAMVGLSSEKKMLDKMIVAVEHEMVAAETALADFNRVEEEKKRRVFALQDEMQAYQSSINKVVDRRNELQISIAKLDTRQEDLANEVYAEMHLDIKNILERNATTVSATELVGIQEKIQKCKYQMSLIGGIDEEVVKEHEETKTKYDFLTGQLSDLRRALGDLKTAVQELDEIMKKKRDKAFKLIRKEFSRYFELLFEGGKADLVEIYAEEEESVEMVNGELASDGVISPSDIPVESDVVGRKKKEQILIGIDAVACPPGKKIKNIQALSGGERTLTSIALVCAILNINPSPFVVLDEVEAALDEANTLRFNKILHELAMRSQFLLITHNQVTMHTADALYGVTMGNDGISRLLSVKLD